MTGPATLIVGPSWVGDMVMAQALFILLKARKPDIVIDVLAPAWSLPIVARMPEVRRGIAAETGHGELGLGKRRRIGYTLRDAGYEHAIVLPRSLKSALIPWFARIPRRTGFRGESRYGLINDMDWETTGRIASLMGAIKIESFGTQNHTFERDDFELRFEESFGRTI